MGIGLLGTMIGGAVGGAGKGLAQVGEMDLQDQIARAREESIARIKMTLESHKTELARQQMTSNIGNATNSIVDQGMASKYAGSDAAVADANAGNTVAPITPEQQASIDQAKAQDRQAMASSDDTYIKAARQTGYIEPKDVLSNATRAELGQLKADTYRESMQNKADIADAKGDIALQIAAMRNGGSQEPKITPTQKMHNFEIDKAREIVASLSPDEIKKKTAKFTNTGRENPDFDPNLANRVRIASKRKVGDDPEFDQVQSPTTATTGNDVQTRFTSDSAMKGYKLGQQDANGYQVLDANGKLLGHYK